ncbi:MAG: ATP-binding cassette domain-containing protein, partial [Solobacterium sp.]|nr:ATP-binding cassette domain-containing protein [Solobacterium sp.]
AMIFQNAALFPHTRVRHNIAYGLHKLGYTEDEIERMVNETAQLLHIETQLNKYPGALSGGQLQRAGIARAIVRRPEILLLDEPFSSLDKPLRAELIQELDRIRRDRGMTMIYVTHDVDEIRDYADSIVELRPAVEHLVSEQ